MATEQISLAPAAGSGIGKLLADKLLAHPDFVDLMVATIINGLKATRSYWTGKGESAELITEADSKTQLQAFALVLAHMEGEPIKRVIHQHINSGAIDPLATLKDSPATRDALRRLLDKAVFHESGRNTKTAEAVLDVG